jgi:diguanylate cyclase (GGDEF)-like protein
MSSARRSNRPLLAAASVFLVSAMVAAGLIWQLETRLIQLERARVANLAANYSHAIQSNIERALSASYAVAALVRQGNGRVDNFEAVAGEMLPYYPGLSALMLAPAGVIRQAFPFVGNEKAIGHDLLKDPARTKEAFLARDTGKLTLAGPFNLVQGGLGAAGRLPVFLQGTEPKPSFWGFSSVLIRFPDVLKSAHLADLTRQGMDYELFRIHPDSGNKQVIDASSFSPLIDPVADRLEVPNATWTLNVAPSRGWGSPLRLSVSAALGMLFAVLSAVLARFWVDMQAIEAQLRDQAEQIQSLAFYDTLTQLPNRRMLSDRIQIAMAASQRSGRYGALMFLDLDNFKPLNDRYGHGVGDLLLVEVARRITGCIRKVDTVARFGGDEFIVMLSELDADKAESVAQAARVAEKIRAALADTYRLSVSNEKNDDVDIEHQCTSSIGVVLFLDHRQSEEKLLNLADIAMYQAKEAGRNVVRFHGE